MLTQEERKRVEQRLGEEREGAIESIRGFEAGRDESLQESTGELTVYRFHPADIGTEMIEQEKQFLLASNEGRRLYEIDEALRRLYGRPDDFGRCERCGGDIGFERLDVVPWATLCGTCQRLIEEKTASR